ncbi:hypothetical protein CEUSTIGMA_g11541.t1, partial [Chlamydomonas eustigma]
MSNWPAIRDDLRSSSVNERLKALSCLLTLANHHNLTIEEFADFVDISSVLLTDTNFKVAQQTLQALSKLVCKEPDAIKPYANSIIPLVAERLADARQPVRQDACEVLLKLLAALGADSVVPRMSRFWTHRNWKVRHGVLQTFAQAIENGIPKLMNHQDLIITQVINLVEDPNELVRDAALECLEELYRVLGSVLTENLKRQSIRLPLFKEVVARLNQIAPTDVNLPEHSNSTGSAAGNRRRSTQDYDTASSSGRRPDTTSSSVDGVVKVDVSHPSTKQRSTLSSSKGEDAEGEGPIPVVLSTEKELVSELESMTALLSSLVPDWQQRIAAMARLEGIVVGSPHLLDMLNEMMRTGLRGSLTKQVEDRRSAVNKQACHTLTVLGAALGVRFSDHASYFLPVLFKVLPITVQIMAESADSCCQALIRSCPSHRLMPVMVAAATKEKNSKIRGLCCGYVALMMEHWDVHLCVRCSEDFEIVMRSSVSDASAEGRQAARRTFVAYAVKAPDHAAAFLGKLDPGLREKLSKGTAGGGERPVSARPRIAARRPLSAFSGAASKASIDEVVVYAPPAPIHGNYYISGSSSSSAQQAPPSRPPPTPSSSVAPTSTAAAAAAALQSSIRKPPIGAPQRQSSLQDSIVHPAHYSSLASASTAGSMSHFPVRSGSAAAQEDVPPAAAAAPLDPQSSLSQRTGSSYKRTSGSTASELPPMSARQYVPGGRKSISVFGAPQRVLPGGLPSSEGTSSQPPALASSQGPALDSAAQYVHMLLQNGTGTDPAAASKLGSKGRRSSTGMPGLMALGSSSTIHPAQPATTALRVPAASSAGSGIFAPVPLHPHTTSAPSSHRDVAASGQLASLRGVVETSHSTTELSVPGSSSEQQAAWAPPSARRVSSFDGYDNHTAVSLPLEGGSPRRSNSSWGGSSAGQPVPAAAAAAPPLPPPPPKQTVSKLVASLLSAPKTWNEKVEALVSIAALLQQSADSALNNSDHSRDQAADAAHLSRDVDKLVPKLVECVEDSHHKVSAAALEVMRASVRACPHALDTSVERWMPPLFQRTVDPRDSTRALATTILADCSQSYSADVLLSGLTRSLDACKLPRVKTAVLEYACCHIGQGRPASVPANASLIKQWLRLLCSLLSDKNLELRRAATEATESLYILVDPALVTSYASYATGPEALALRRVIGGVHEREQEVPEQDAMIIDSPAASPARQPGAAATAMAPFTHDQLAVSNRALQNAHNSTHYPSSSEAAAAAHPAVQTLHSFNPQAPHAQHNKQVAPYSLTSTFPPACSNTVDQHTLSPTSEAGHASRSFQPSYEPTQYGSPLRIDRQLSEPSMLAGALNSIHIVDDSSTSQATTNTLDSRVHIAGTHLAGTNGQEKQQMQMQPWKGGSYQQLLAQRRAASAATSGPASGAAAAPRPGSAASAAAYSSSLDPAAATRQVSLFIHRLQQTNVSSASSEQLSECYDKLSELVPQTPAAAWLSGSAAVVAAMAAGLRSEEGVTGGGGSSNGYSIRAAASRLAAVLACHQPAVLQRTLEVALPALLLAAAGGASGSKELSKSCYDTLVTVLDATPVLRAMELLIPNLPFVSSASSNKKQHNSVLESLNS